jgi:hypothetical protein
MLLGDLMARVQEPSFATEALLALDDITLVARINTEAAHEGLQPGEFIGQSIASFVSGATDEEWLGMIGALSRAENPGQAFLHRVLSKAVAR